MRILALALLGASGIASCNEARGRPAPTPVAPPAPAVPAAAPGFELHEWGLLGLTVDSHALTVASGSAPMGHHAERGVSGGKPVLYVHLDPGTESATFDVRIGLRSQGRFLEHWPGGRVEGTTLVFPGVVASPGACAAPTPAPAALSPACAAVPDGYCEAAEIPRYHGDRASCLALEGEQSELLFYRAAQVDVGELPLDLVREGGELLLRSSAPIAGPILWIELLEDGTVVRRRLDPDRLQGSAHDLEGTELDAEAARALVLAEGRARGLGDAEAEAFVDAWSPALFTACRRSGPEAFGPAPASLGIVERALLYFAPEALVQGALPLETVPPARATKRVFLVRIVDPTRLSTLPDPPRDGLLSSPLGPRPRTELTSSRVGAGLSEDAVRRILLRNVSQIQRCYEQYGLSPDPEAAGRVDVRVVVGADGRVLASSLLASSMRAEVDGCVVAASRRWAFPLPEPQSPVTVDARYTFSLVRP